MSNKWKVRSPENDFLFTTLAKSKILSGNFLISRLKCSLFELLKLSSVFNSLSKYLRNQKFSLNIAKWNTTKNNSLSAKDSLIMPTIQPTQHWKRTEKFNFFAMLVLLQWGNEKKKMFRCMESAVFSVE